MPLRVLRSYARQLPRIAASIALRDAQAARVARVKNPRPQMKAWQDIADGRGSRRHDGGLGALAAMRMANERARAEGTLLP